LGAGLQGSLLSGFASVALVLHYFLGWRFPLLSGNQPMQEGSVSLCACDALFIFASLLSTKGNLKWVVLFKSSNGRCWTNFVNKVCKISIHVSSRYQNLGVNVLLAKLSKWQQNNMHTSYIYPIIEIMIIYICDVHAYVTNNIV